MSCKKSSLSEAAWCELVVTLLAILFLVAVNVALYAAIRRSPPAPTFALPAFAKTTLRVR